MRLAADPCRHAVGPSSFDQHAPCQHIAGLGDAAAPHAGAGRMFGGHQAEIGHQLTRIGEASKVSDLGYHGEPTCCVLSAYTQRLFPNTKPCSRPIEIMFTHISLLVSANSTRDLSKRRSRSSNAPSGSARVIPSSAFGTNRSAMFICCNRMRTKRSGRSKRRATTLRLIR